MDFSNKMSTGQYLNPDYYQPLPTTVRYNGFLFSYCILARASDNY